MGLKADDLIVEETPNVQKALGRLSEEEAYSRVFRIRRAFQCSLNNNVLPKSEWTTEEEDTFYLSPLIEEVEAEEAERRLLDNTVLG